MGASGNLGGAAASAGNAYVTASSAKTQAKFQKAMHELNKEMSGYQAGEAVKKGDKDATAYKKKGKQVVGAQRAAMAAQGIDIESGSAAEVQTDTVEQVEQDALKIKNNAWREAWGYQAQAVGHGRQGSLAMISGRAQANQSIATGGMQVAGYLNEYARDKKKGM